MIRLTRAQGVLMFNTVLLDLYYSFLTESFPSNRDLKVLPWATLICSGWPVYRVVQKVKNAYHTFSTVCYSMKDALLKCVFMFTTWRVAFPSNHIWSSVTSQLKINLSFYMSTLNRCGFLDNIWHFENSFDICSSSSHVFLSTCSTLDLQIKASSFSMRDGISYVAFITTLVFRALCFRSSMLYTCVPFSKALVYAIHKACFAVCFPHCLSIDFHGQQCQSQWSNGRPFGQLRRLCGWILNLVSLFVLK